MCGIYGEINLAGVDLALAEEATERLRHRGPDERGSWLGEAVFLGMRRLSIIDLAGGQQPIWNEEGTRCIIFNGELYNFLDLRPDLIAKGHVFRSESDTEVVLHSYDEWGVDCLQRLNGMFAFAIWDETKNELFVARDRIGEKPLYYYREAGRLLFSSEIKALLTDPKVPRELNPRGLTNFLTFGHSVAPETIYKNIFKLLPAHYLIASRTGFSIHEYWDVGDEPQPLFSDTALTDTDYAKAILALLDDSVRRRIVADVPVGAFLSGGVDSSAIVALMKRHASGPVRTFSLGFSIGGAYNELAEARTIARHFGTEHHELNVEHADLVETLRTLVYHYDEPFGDAASFPLYLLSRFAREHVKVVLSGDGGDELFGGYRRYGADRFANSYQRLPQFLTSRLIPEFVGRLPRLRRTKRALETLPIRDPALRYAGWLTLFTPEMLTDLLRPNVADNGHNPFALYAHYYDRAKRFPCSDHLNRLMYIDLKTWLPDAYLEKADKATMACSLEARLPLLDHRLVELAFQIPGRLKISGHSLKRIFKLALEGVVPAEVLRRPKHGFAVPTDPWFRGELKEFTFSVLLDGPARARGYFNSKAIERLWREHAEGRHVWDSHLWLLLNFELWHQLYLDGDSL